MRIEWTRWAVDQWLKTFEYLESENAPAALRIAQSIFEVVNMLADHPLAGRKGMIAGTREFAVPRSPFIIAYEVNRSSDTLTIITVFDGRRRWPSAFPKD
ncbi:MAG TPA: type II toxin-antitoxin system RelE/ParE family toxin [Acidobacteriaceae bacterium]|nr:type II toxin-antitoxin system RelE/ParE family toxin [Acidobacteriaceae bacterium]